MRTVVLDTNVLLAHPDFLTGFPETDVVVPDTVLSEIDKLKTARVDPELRYRGREVSRILFELSELGNLQEGVPVPGSGTVRVSGLRNESELPEGLSPRNADDRILAVALQEREAGCERLTLVTNDLNMLLKAQALDIEVERAEVADSFSRRFIVRPFQRYKVPIGILAVAIAVFAAVIALVVWFPAARTPAGIGSLPPEFVDQMSLEQQQMLVYLFRLQEDPDDAETHLALANLYDNMAAQDMSYLPLAIKHYETVKKLTPTNYDARTDLAADYFQAGRIDAAIQESKAVLTARPEHVNANFNLGLFYLSAKPARYQDAANQFQKVIRLTETHPALASVTKQAKDMLAKVVQDAEAAGQPVKTDGGTL